jgi:hypothetical protein
MIKNDFSLSIYTYPFISNRHEVQLDINFRIEEYDYPNSPHLIFILNKKDILTIISRSDKEATIHRFN